MSTKRHIIASFFLAVFAVMQLVDLHVAAHDADHEDCAVCQLAIAQGDTGFDTVCLLQISTPVSEIILTATTPYTNAFVENRIHFSFQNKAPPAA